MWPSRRGSRAMRCSARRRRSLQRVQVSDTRARKPRKHLPLTVEGDGPDAGRPALSGGGACPSVVQAGAAAQPRDAAVLVPQRRQQQQLVGVGVGIAAAVAGAAAVAVRRPLAFRAAKLERAVERLIVVRRLLVPALVLIPRIAKLHPEHILAGLDEGQQIERDVVHTLGVLRPANIELPPLAHALAVDRQLEVPHPRDEDRCGVDVGGDGERRGAEEAALEAGCDPLGVLPVGAVEQAGVEGRAAAVRHALRVPAVDGPWPPLSGWLIYQPGGVV